MHRTSQIVSCHQLCHRGFMAWNARFLQIFPIALPCENGKNEGKRSVNTHKVEGKYRHLQLIYRHARCHVSTPFTHACTIPWLGQ